MTVYLTAEQIVFIHYCMRRSVFEAERHFIFGEERRIREFTLRVAKSGQSEGDQIIATFRLAL